MSRRLSGAPLSSPSAGASGCHHRSPANAVTTGRCPGCPGPATGDLVEVGQGGEEQLGEAEEENHPDYGMDEVVWTDIFRKPVF